jgi:hypothetical protein
MKNRVNDDYRILVALHAGLRCDMWFDGQYMHTRILSGDGRRRCPSNASLRRLLNAGLIASDGYSRPQVRGFEWTLPVTLTEAGIQVAAHRGSISDKRMLWLDPVDVEALASLA